MDIHTILHISDCICDITLGKIEQTQLSSWKFIPFNFVVTRYHYGVTHDDIDEVYQKLTDVIKRETLSYNCIACFAIFQDIILIIENKYFYSYTQKNENLRKMLRRLTITNLYLMISNPPPSISRAPGLVEAS